MAEAQVVRPGWTHRSWAPWVMALVSLVLIGAPARVWLSAAVVSIGDPEVPGLLTALWVVLGLLPLAVGTLAWLLLRRQPAGRRFVVAALFACPVGLVTMVPITPYLLGV